MVTLPVYRVQVYLTGLSDKLIAIDKQVREVALLNLLTVSIFTYGKRAIIHDFLVYMYNSTLGIKGRRSNLAPL